MVAIAAGALSGRVFRLPRGIMPPVRSGRWRVVERRAFEEAGGVVGVRPRGRGEDKDNKAGARKHRSLPRKVQGRNSAFLDCLRALCEPENSHSHVILKLVRGGRQVASVRARLLARYWTKTHQHRANSA